MDKFLSHFFNVSIFDDLLGLTGGRGGGDIMQCQYCYHLSNVNLNNYSMESIELEMESISTSKILSKCITCAFVNLTISQKFEN